jgi:FMN phosphatase YigB (HAD superfamily)
MVDGVGQRQVVFWDFDGTLAVREGTWSTILHEAILAADPSIEVAVDGLAAGLLRGFPDWEAGEPRVYPDAAAWWSAASPVLIRACVGTGVDRRIAENAVVEIPRIYYRPAAWRVMRGALSSLETTARAGLVNVVLSNHAPELPHLIEDLGLGPLVERAITSASLGVEKPNPIMFQSALGLTDAAPDSWMIGDNPITDVAGARAVGMRALLVHHPTGDGRRLTLEDAAQEIIRSLPNAGLTDPARH